MFKRILSAFLLVVLIFGVLGSVSVAGDLPTDQPFVNSVVEQIRVAAGNWVTKINKHALVIFWSLVLISMVWTFGKMIFQPDGSIGSVFGEFIRFCVFIGFWRFALQYNHQITTSIVEGLSQLGTDAGGEKLTASEMLGQGLRLFDTVMAATANAGIVDRLLMAIVGFVIFVVVTIIGANLAYMLIVAYVLCYAGIFYLCFGGSKWTSDMAVNYYRSVLGIGINIMSTMFLIGVINETITMAADSYALDKATMELKQDITFQGLFSLLAVTLIMGAMALKVPPMLAGIVSGATGSVEPIMSVGGAAGWAASTAIGAARSASNGQAAFKAALSKSRQNAQFGEGKMSGGVSTMNTARDVTSILAGNIYSSWRQGGGLGSVAKSIQNSEATRQEQFNSESTTGGGGGSSGAGGASGKGGMGGLIAPLSGSAVNASGASAKAGTSGLGSSSAGASGVGAVVAAASPVSGGSSSSPSSMPPAADSPYVSSIPSSSSSSGPSASSPGAVNSASSGGGAVSGSDIKSVASGAAGRSAAGAAAQSSGIDATKAGPSGIGEVVSGVAAASAAQTSGIDATNAEASGLAQGRESASNGDWASSEYGGLDLTDDRG